MPTTGRQGRDRPDTWLGYTVYTGQEDRGGYRPDAGCMTNVWGTGNVKRDEARG